MALLLQCHKVSKSFGTRVLFNDVSLSIFERDQLGLIGVNGSGKSTLLKIMSGLERADAGAVTSRKGLKIGYVPQDSSVTHRSLTDILLKELDEDLRPSYEKELEVEILLDKMGFKDLSLLDTTLSGGWKKKLDIACKLIHGPELLFLDEPTNHLDVESIFWLEKFLKNAPFAFVVVSHDRAFLSNVTGQTAELGKQFPDGIFHIDAPYERFLECRRDFLEGQKTREESLRSKARREEAWLRANPKARTTKSTARIDAAGELLSELAAVKKRNEKKNVSIDFYTSERETRKLVAAHQIAYSYGARIIFEKLNLTLSPKMRLGLLGTNGSGKTTLLKVLAGELKPLQGVIKYVEGIKIVYFDQNRFQLPLNVTIREALAPRGDYVFYQNREIHVHSWAERFLFSSELLDMPVSKLSGGEKARLLMAKLMLEPADFLLLDEPTNDLDIPTLEVLEESLLDFPGALVLITHDRAMLGRVCNQFLAIGSETQPEFCKGFTDWVERVMKKADLPPSSSCPPLKEKAAPTQPKKSGKATKELADLEKNIFVLEKELKVLEGILSEGSAEDLALLCEKIGALHAGLDTLYQRWEALNKLP